MRNLIRNILLLSALGYSCTQSSNTTFESITDQLRAKYEGKTAGVAMAVVNESKEIWSNSFGMANIANFESMTVDHVINIASVSKLFVATAVMQLVEEGVLNLQTDINEYLPFAVVNPKYPTQFITVEQLLTHRSSIQDSPYYEDSYTADTTILRLEDWLRSYFTPRMIYYSEENFSANAPGTIKQYSNLGYGLLGLIVEQVSSQSFDEYCEVHIFQPLKMESTKWLRPQPFGLAATAYLYMEELPGDEMLLKLNTISTEPIVAKEYIPLRRYRFPNYPDGLLYSSVNDLKKFVQMVLNGGAADENRILKEEPLKQMLSLNGVESDKQGLGWSYSGMGAIWGHGGDDPGVQTGLYLDIESKLGMIMIKNSNVGSRTDLLKQLYKAARLESQ